MAEIPIKPPWVNDDPNVPPAEPRDDKGRFVPGISGNPAGRAPGVRNKRNVVAVEFEKQGSEVARVVMAKALEGDMQAASLVLTRISPPLRSRPPTVEFELDVDAEPSAMSKAVLTAVATGQIDPDTAKIVLDMVSAHIGMRDLETFLAELRRLKTSKPIHAIPGGVVYQ